ncbi:MAG TPA: DMT family transporter [Polyangiaceae bacterium]|nr:DMT family transporter [Polyangiaceae bacterium]
MSQRQSPLVAGAGLAILAALSFGVTAPIIAMAGANVGPLVTASLLYAGAAASALVMSQLARSNGAPFERAHVRRLLAMALVGAGVAPTLLAWGLKHTGATAGSLLLNLEAVFTAALAWSFYREALGKRVLAALTLMVLGGAVLTLSGSRSSGYSGLGVAAVAGATLAWGIDNTLSRGLSQQDPVAVVGLKGALGAAATALAAWLLGERLPSLAPLLVLLACGASGYGLSLRLYLLAQRRIGAARTGSIFAVAPFVGAAVAWALGDHHTGAGTALSASLFLGGLVLHLTERHHHEHSHPDVDHDHPHRHDDGHHNHQHEPPFTGEHSHPHHHERLEHDHDHAPDVHHDHLHE